MTVSENKLYLICLAEARSSRSQMFFKIGILKKIVTFTRRHLCWNLFFNEVEAFRPATLLKKRLLHRFFPVNTAKCSKTAFLSNSPGGWWSYLFIYLFIYFLIDYNSLLRSNKILDMPKIFYSSSKSVSYYLCIFMTALAASIFDSLVKPFRLMTDTYVEYSINFIYFQSVVFIHF